MRQVFLKFGEYHHLQDFRQGKLYCNTLQYFTQVEDNNDGRKDEDENVISYKYRENVTLQIKSADAPDSDYHQFTAARFQLKERLNGSIGNLFCLYFLNLDEHPADGEIAVDNRCKGFGNHFVAIHNISEFIDRVTVRLDELNYGYKAKVVTYKDFSKFSGLRNWFEKDIKYDYQKEYRLLINTSFSEPFLLDIGNIEEITSDIWKCPEDILFKHTRSPGRP